jgi:hypothetical protein
VGSVAGGSTSFSLELSGFLTSGRFFWLVLCFFFSLS